VRLPPDLAHPFGTDDLGILSRVTFGAGASLAAGFISVVIGVPLRLLAGYFGSVTDVVISRCADAVLACPFLVLAIALAAFLGPSLAAARERSVAMLLERDPHRLVRERRSLVHIGFRPSKVFFFKRFRQCAHRLSRRTAASTEAKSARSTWA
jgi:ABC-type antimicrobial peptide transport system permease subunit